VGCFFLQEALLDFALRRHDPRRRNHFAFTAWGGTLLNRGTDREFCARGVTFLYADAWLASTGSAEGPPAGRAGPCAKNGGQVRARRWVASLEAGGAGAFQRAFLPVPASSRARSSAGLLGARGQLLRRPAAQCGGGGAFSTSASCWAEDPGLILRGATYRGKRGVAYAAEPVHGAVEVAPEKAFSSDGAALRPRRDTAALFNRANREGGFSRGQKGRRSSYTAFGRHTSTPAKRPGLGVFWPARPPPEPQVRHLPGRWGTSPARLTGFTGRGPAPCLVGAISSLRAARGRARLRRAALCRHDGRDRQRLRDVLKIESAPRALRLRVGCGGWLARRHAVQRRHAARHRRTRRCDFLLAGGCEPVDDLGR